MFENLMAKLGLLVGERVFIRSQFNFYFQVQWIKHLDELRSNDPIALKIPRSLMDLHCKLVSESYKKLSLISSFFSLADQSLNGQTVGDIISAPVNNTHHISTIGANRVPLISLQSGIAYRPPFVHPHAMGGPHYFPRGPMIRMHGDR